MADTETQKQVGEVTHFFAKIGVAIVKFSEPVPVGTKLHYQGAHVDFESVVDSMQFEHASIPGAKPGQEVGIKVLEKVHEGVLVYLASE